MPKVNVYLPEQLYKEVRRHDLPVSAITQEALTSALRELTNREWVDSVTSRRRRVATRIDTSQLLDDVRAEFGS